MAKKKVTIEASLRGAAAGKADGTVADALISGLREGAAYARGDQTPPCAILWPDGEKTWSSALGELRALIPELYVLGEYSPAERQGPAIWLRCVVARCVAGGPPPEAVAVLYLPGVSRQTLRSIEDCPEELQPLAELQFRGSVWMHSNGKDWTPAGFLSSDRGGLDLELAKDEGTIESLSRALPRVLKEKVGDLRSQRLDSSYFDELLSPDLPRTVLAWMNESQGKKSGKADPEWVAFCKMCQTALLFHPEKDGALKAAELLGECKGAWKEVWARFSDAPRRYAKVMQLLEQADPEARGQFPFKKENWPKQNQAMEESLGASLLSLKDKTHDEATDALRVLEEKHGARRDWVWSEVGQAQFAVALERLTRLASLTKRPLAAGTAAEFAEIYAEEGWQTDACAIDALACATAGREERPIATAVRTLYFEWLDLSARNLQQLCQDKPEALKPRLPRIEPAPGRAIVFADGLRYDLARRLPAMLGSLGLEAELAWDFAPYPTVTPTAKPVLSPVADSFVGTEAGDDFAVAMKDSSQRWSQERFIKLLQENGVQYLENIGDGDVTGCAWLETGTIDKHGHDDGWKLARQVQQEVQDLADKVHMLISIGWQEVVVVTDHGWLVMPGGLPKATLPKYLVESRWGRCAALKPNSSTDLPTHPWYWNSSVWVATPPGAACFKAGLEYCHGGISAQELLAPRLTVKAGRSAARISSVKWIGFRCRVAVEGEAGAFSVDIREQQAEPTTSVIAGKRPVAISPDGTVSVIVPDDSKESARVEVVLVTGEGAVIQAVATKVGE